MTFLPFTHLLKKRSSNFLQDGFAVCELPFYEICDKNVSRIQCSALGCCFHKEVCYKKAVPSYMQVFIILILVIMAAFILFVCHSCVVKKNRSKRMHPPVDMSEPSVTSSSESNEEDMLQE
ncbi:testis-expressed sequence 29 protein [Alligator mississippiensis]|uniref:Testis-expressed sequence 29 protein n=1 Tax=Alligator mississippiensis TaxID=8496 RepID=A0A151NX14_ALLMI|nr:testis-expressed sequence 29 protein [Alligator mississippiensis]